MQRLAVVGTLVAIFATVGCGNSGSSSRATAPAETVAVGTDGGGGSAGRLVTSSRATLAAIPVDGGTPQSVGPPRSFSFVSRPSLSPDGTAIAFGAQACAGCAPALTVAPRAGGPGRRLYTYGSQPDWSPSGRELAFVYSTPNGASRGLLVYLIDRDGRHAREIEIERDEEGGEREAVPVYQDPTFSADGRLLAFVAETEPHEVQQIFLLALGTGKVRQLTEGAHSAVDPAFAPDGRTLAYACETASHTHDICLADVSSGRRSTLVRSSGDDRNPTFSPSAATIVFESNLADRTNAIRSLYSVSRTGGRLQRLTSGFDASEPTFTPDGRQIVFIRRSIRKL